jgi:hypothetical protein
VSTRSKKKVTRKPKANAVKSKRRPHKPATVRRPRPPHDRAAESQPTSEPITEQSTEPTTEPTMEQSTEPATRWAVDDPTAMWWDDVWPFRDETREAPTLAETTEQIAVLDEPDLTPYVEPDEDPALAVPPLSVPPAARSQGLAWLSVLVAAAVVVGVLVWWSNSRGTEEQAIAVHGHSYAPPVHLDRGSSLVRSRVLPSGDVVVKHWIRTDLPVRSVNLRVPRVAGLPPHALAISDLILASNGTQTVASSPVDPVGVSTFALPPTNWLYVRYRLSGVVQSSGGPGRRALARLTALDVTTSSPVQHTTLAVVGAKVLSLACTAHGQNVPTPCGTDSNGTWSTHLGQGEQGSQVMAQVNLS